MTGRPEATAQSNRLRLSGPTSPHSSVLRPLPQTLRTPPWESRRIEGAGIPLAWMKYPSGIYVLELQLSRKIHLKAGALQRRILLPGRYFYVGRAMRGLAARLNRHRVKVKSSPRWHIDYLRSRTFGRRACAPHQRFELGMRNGKRLVGRFRTNSDPPLWRLGLQVPCSPHLFSPLRNFSSPPRVLHRPSSTPVCSIFFALPLRRAHTVQSVFLRECR